MSRLSIISTKKDFLAITSNLDPILLECLKIIANFSALILYFLSQKLKPVQERNFDIVIKVVWSRKCLIWFHIFQNSSFSISTRRKEDGGKSCPLSPLKNMVPHFKGSFISKKFSQTLGVQKMQQKNCPKLPRKEV